MFGVTSILQAARENSLQDIKRQTRYRDMAVHPRAYGAECETKLVLFLDEDGTSTSIFFPTIHGRGMGEYKRLRPLHQVFI